MLFSKKYNTRSSRKRSMGKRISKKRNMIGGDFPINVNFQGQTITFSVNPDYRIGSLAWKIEDWSKKAHNLDIYFNGNLLKTYTTIQDNGITQNSTIVAKEKDVGIMSPPPPSPPPTSGMLSNGESRIRSRRSLT
jgi:hypothetical protein